MPRKGHIAKRGVVGDPVFGSDLVTKFVNSMMWQGKRSTAEGIFYEALTKLESKGGDEALKLFKKAVENTKPLLEVKTRRVGGANYQVPVEVNADRRTSLAIFAGSLTGVTRTAPIEIYLGLSDNLDAGLATAAVLIAASGGVLLTVKLLGVGRARRFTPL